MLKNSAVHSCPQVCRDRGFTLAVSIESLTSFINSGYVAISAQAANDQASEEGVKMTLRKAKNKEVTHVFRVKVHLDEWDYYSDDHGYHYCVSVINR